jgi:hypothetical protein
MQPDEWLASEVLRFSISRRASTPVAFYVLNHLPGALADQVGANYPLYRFAIPELCSYRGKAIYLNAASMVLCDIQEIFSLPMSNGALARKMDPDQESSERYTQMMLLDCAKLTSWNISSWKTQLTAETIRKTVFAESGGLATADFGDLPKEYLSIDACTEKTKVLNYSFVPTQPWRQAGHPCASIFLHELKLAILNEDIPIEMLYQEVAEDRVYPSILMDLEWIL